jgi:hypothetical protein
MTQPADSAPVRHAGVLPANVDDPRFAPPAAEPAPAEWSAGRAVAAEVHQPLDGEPFVLQALLEFAGQLLDRIINAAIDKL